MTLSLVVIVQRTEFKALTDNAYKQVVAGLSERQATEIIEDEHRPRQAALQFGFVTNVI